MVEAGQNLTKSICYVALFFKKLEQKKINGCKGIQVSHIFAQMNL